jgi:Spy/CpxP family protein refolding chaperone
MMRTLLLTGILLTTVAFAQRGVGGGEEMGGGMGEGGGARGGLSLPSISPSRMSRLDTMAAILKLNKEQKKQVKSIMDEGQKQGAAVRDEIAKRREQLGEAIASGKSQDEISQAVKAYAELEGQMARIELDAFAKIYQLLDNEQRSKTAPIFQMIAGIFMNKNWNET